VSLLSSLRPRVLWTTLVGGEDFRRINKLAGTHEVSGWSCVTETPGTSPALQHMVVSHKMLTGAILRL
jgi:hypothetical protein